MRRHLPILLPLVLVLTSLVTAGKTVHAAATPNTWTTDASLGTAIAYAPAVTSSSDSKTYTVDGQGSGGYVGTVNAYTPGTNTWATRATDPTTRQSPGVATTSDGKIYSLGGTNGSPLAHAAYYSPTGNSWTSLTSLPTARYGLGAVVGADGRVYAVGGQTNTAWKSTVEAYDPVAAKWYCSGSGTGCTSTATPPLAMPTARSNFGIVVKSGLIYTIGGQTAASTYTNVVEAYDPVNRVWTCSTGDAGTGCTSTTLTPMPTARTTGAAVDSNGIIYVIGGTNGAYQKSVEAYNPTTNAWECSSTDAASGCTATPLVDMPTARAFAGVATGSDGNIYVVGGYNGSYLTTVQSYGPLALPGSPTAVTGTAGDSSATLTWTVPASIGGTPITTYTASCTPACTPVTSNSTSATITGLTNGTSYTFTVTATNFVGAGTASAASNAVTPSCGTGTGSLSVGGATIGNFSVTLTGSDQQVYTSLSSYTASNTTCSGWSVQFQAARLQNSGGDQFPAGSLLMPAPTVSSCQSGCGTGSTSNPPAICIHTGSVALDGATAVTVASAAINTGKGSYTFTPGTIGSGNLQLTIPSYAFATAYSSTLTVTIAQGPASTC